MGDESKRRAKAKVMDTIASSEVMDSPFAHLPKEVRLGKQELRLATTGYDF